MNAEPQYEFKGDPQHRPSKAHRDSPKTPEPYLASDELKQAVNLAIYLRRPLLLEGEAGCGKTRLALAVAYELGLPFYRWDVRSTSRAQEGLYEYDAILRLHDVEASKLAKPVDRDPAKASTYVEPGALGKAFALKTCPAVVLIDEIDKADLDFPNDLLAVLDDPWTFRIRETGTTVTATHKPIVIMTSNKEKGNLPAPFLRRCLYYFLEFPQNHLKQIVAQHCTVKQKEISEQLVDTAIARFLEVRAEGGLFKKPGTSEFLDWLHALASFAGKAYDAATLAQDTALPYRELLFKLQADWKKFRPAP